jgi:ABC-2 type transport system permease protein
MSLFLLQLKGELWKLFARKRTYLGFAVFLGVEILVLVLFQIPMGKRWLRHTMERMGGVFEQYFSGLTLSMIMLPLTIVLLGALFICLIGGDIVAKEAEDGTLRMSLCRPISRLRLLALKYCTCVIYTVALVFFIGISALCAATLVRGTGGLFFAAPEEGIVALFDFGPGLQRYLTALPLLCLSLTTMTTFSFQLSCWNIKPASATIAAICFFFVDWILHILPYFEVYRPWMMTSHMNSWLSVFRTPVPWQRMVEDYTYLLALDATFLIVGAAIFSARDFKS